jgi:vancomycin aglycone glucosyltransferase
MRTLLSSVGTRGDVQPVIALALKVRALGAEVRLCVPPNFVDWARSLGFEAFGVGVEMRAPSSRAPSPPPAPMPDLITDQFDAVGAAAEGCDVILGANAHQYAARSIAELRRVPYVTALYAPVAIPSAELPPPPAPGQAWEPGETNLQRWVENRAAWNKRALERVNQNRSRLGLAAIDDVLLHNITDRPWLATDPALGPKPAGLEIFQTGAWILEDTSPLSPELSRFLDAGEPPVYLGFGSMPAPPDAGRTLIAAARAAGRRAILSQGWAELSAGEAASDCMAIGDVNQQALFPRLAAVVHHGGAGTTAAAARAAVPQVIVPMFGDQFYWASRVGALGLGASVVGPLNADALAAALRAALQPDVAARCKRFAPELSGDGAEIAARRLISASRFL